MPVPPSKAVKISTLTARRHYIRRTSPTTISTHTAAASSTALSDRTHPVGYFGYKVLALSYGGTLQLFGKKGAHLRTPRVWRGADEQRNELGRA